MLNKEDNFTMKRKFTKYPVKASDSLIDREALIDYIDAHYNTLENYELLESEITQLGGSLDDSGDEGIYSDLSNAQLVKLKHRLDQF